MSNPVASAIRNVTEHASSIVRLELELAALELKKKVTALGVGIGLGVVAALLGLFAIGFAFATVAAALATFLATWLALLIVTLVLFGLAALLAMLAVARFRKATPPVPEQALREAELTVEAIRR